MDMDGIKQMNDTYGHAFGAYAIAETGRIVKTLIGKKGLASRFGGDEFMAFIPNASIENARCIGEEIRGSVMSKTTLLSSRPFASASAP